MGVGAGFQEQVETTKQREDRLEEEGKERVRESWRMGMKNELEMWERDGAKERMKAEEQEQEWRSERIKIAMV